MSENILFIAAIIGVFLAVVLYRFFKLHNARCTKCGGKMKLENLLDSAGINLTKKVTFSLYIGPRKYNEIWVCETCSSKTKMSYWGS